MANSSSRRVVITGLGVVSPLGNDPGLVIARLRDGTSGIRPLTQVPQGILGIDHGAEAIEFTGDISDYGPLEKTLARTIKKGSKVMSREIEMGVAVAQLAMHDAALTPENRDRDRTGVLYGCDYIMSLPEEFADGIKKCLDDEGNFHFEKWGQIGRPEVNPLWLLKYLPNMPASHIAIYNDLRGPNNSITVREASPAAALSEAYSTIQRGHADVLVVGSTGSRIHALRTLHASLQEKLAADQPDPTTMSRPFDRTRDGSVVGEGAAALVCESLEHAQNRRRDHHRRNRRLCQQRGRIVAGFRTLVPQASGGERVARCVGNDRPQVGRPYPCTRFRDDRIGSPRSRSDRPGFWTAEPAAAGHDGQGTHGQLRRRFRHGRGGRQPKGIGR